MRSLSHSFYVALLLAVGLNAFFLWFLSLQPVILLNGHRRMIPQGLEDARSPSTAVITSQDSRTSLVENQSLPKWVTSYLEWHVQTRKHLNETTWRDHKYLVSRCYVNDPQCGGLVDRLRGLPFLLQVAAMTGRLLVFHWERPCDLTEFLQPRAIDWTLPPFVEVPRHSFTFIRVKDVPYIQKSPETVVSMRLQAYKEAEKFFDRYKVTVDDANSKTVLSPLWNLFFQPSAPIRQQLESFYQEHNLVPSRYFAVHLRTLYAENRTSDKVALVESVRNALACTSKLGGFSSSVPIVVVSDNKKAADFAARLAPHNVINQSARAADDYDGPILHLDRGADFLDRPGAVMSKAYPVEAYYATFVDFYLLIGAKCVAFDRGGFGRLASLLSDDPTCFYDHSRHTC